MLFFGKCNFSTLLYCFTVPSITIIGEHRLALRASDNFLKRLSRGLLALWCCSKALSPLLWGTLLSSRPPPDPGCYWLSAYLTARSIKSYYTVPCLLPSSIEATSLTTKNNSPYFIIPEGFISGCCLGLLMMFEQEWSSSGGGRPLAGWASFGPKETLTLISKRCSFLLSSKLFSNCGNSLTSWFYCGWQSLLNLILIN